MSSCPQCVELENYFDRQILMLKHELKKRDEALEEQEHEIVRLRNLVEWFTQSINTVYTGTQVR